MIQDHAGQSPILIGIPYPVVYEVPMRRRPRPRPTTFVYPGWRQIEQPVEETVNEALSEVVVYNTKPRTEVLADQDIEGEPVFEGPAWMKQN